MEIVRRKKSKPEQPDTSTPSSSKRRTTACIELSTRHLYRRAFSESSLIDACGLFDFKDGESYHFITAGDVDSLSFLKAILRQQNLDYCLLSTWCMSAEDIVQLNLWVDNGQIKRLDTYVGEIFPSTYKVEFAMLKEMYADGGKNVGGGRLAVFRNHSKIYAGYGQKFAFGIETSANVNTNPRTENGCITISDEIYQFYRDYFDGIVSFEYGKV